MVIDSARCGRHGLHLGALLLTLCLSAAPAAASDDALGPAREAFAAGEADIAAERWAEAEAHFRDSAALTRRPGTLYNLGVALRRQGRTAEARVAFQEAAVLYGTAEPARRDASLAAARELDGDRVAPDAPIAGDLPRPGAAAGTAVVAAEAQRDERRRLGVPGDARRNGPIAVLVGGGVLLVGAAVAGGVALSLDRRVVSECPPSELCTDLALRSVRDRALAWGTAAEVLAVAGGLGVLGGGVWWFAGRARPRAARAVTPTLHVGQHGAGASLRIAF